MPAGTLPARLRRTALAVLALPWLAGCIEGLFFHPDDRAWSTPGEFGVQAEDVFIDAPDGGRLHGWWLPAAASPARGSVLHLHGNAANVSNHLPLVAWLPAHGWNVLMVDYRGFGKSRGRPSLDGVVDDARTALAALRSRSGVDASRIVVLGQSLGGATALRLAADNGAKPAPLAGVVVEGAFASYRGIAADAAGPLKWIASPLFSALPADTADPLAAARRLRAPLLVVHGTADRIIPLAHGQALYAAASPPKQWLAVDGGQHLDALMREPVRRRLLDWLERLPP
jgi:fermentation-respiration switch protein FrsA (DUF1100 family)